MAEYFIIALSFAIFYTCRYGIEIAKTIELAIDTFGLDRENANWYPSSFYAALFCFAFIFMPITALSMLLEDRWTTIHRATANILEKHFNFVRKK